MASRRRRLQKGRRIVWEWRRANSSLLFKTKFKHSYMCNIIFRLEIPSTSGLFENNTSLSRTLTSRLLATDLFVPGHWPVPGQSPANYLPKIRYLSACKPPASRMFPSSAAIRRGVSCPQAIGRSWDRVWSQQRQRGPPPRARGCPAPAVYQLLEPPWPTSAPAQECDFPGTHCLFLSVPSRSHSEHFLGWRAQQHADCGCGGVWSSTAHPVSPGAAFCSAGQDRLADTRHAARAGDGRASGDRHW